MIFTNFADDLHNDVEQIRRFEKGIGKKIKILDVDVNNKTAAFEGSSGEIYATSLDGCTCVDCAMRRKPCKHMYRLAVECGLIDVTASPWKSYAEYSKILNDVKKALNTLDIPRLRQVLYYIKTELK